MIALLGSLTRFWGGNPNHVQSHNNLGIIYQQTGQFELAKEHFSKALLLDPNDVEAHK